MSPLYDQDGNETDSVTIAVSADVRSVRVKHDEVWLLDESGNALIVVDRPRHPGAGLGVEVAESAQRDQPVRGV